MNKQNQQKPIDQTWGDNLINQNKVVNTQTQIPISRNSQQNQKSEEIVDIYKNKNVSDNINPKQTLPKQDHVQKIQKKSTLLQIIKIIGVFVSVFVFVYLFLTFPAYYEKIKYWVENLGKKQESTTIEVPVTLDDSSDLFLSTIKTALESEKPNLPQTQSPQAQQYSFDLSDLNNNHLFIPKLNINVPIIWNSPPDESVMLKNLQDGVVHYNGTGLPNQSDGNVFISGHSSYFWWDKGNYKTVFVNLNKLENNDEFALAYEDKVYVYKVYEKIEVKPEEVGVLEPVGKPIVSLMTCVPVGTNLRRLIVKAERIVSGGDRDKPQQEEQPIEDINTTPSPIPTELPKLNPINIINLLPWRW